MSTTNRRILWAALPLICFLAPMWRTQSLYGQCAGQWLPSNGLSAPAKLSLLPDGDVVCAGYFESTSGGAAHLVARYQPATDSWSTFGTGLRGSAGTSFGEVTALDAAPNGDVVVGGNFDTAGGLLSPIFARWSAALQTWQSIASGRLHKPSALKVLPSGDIVACGELFDYAPGQPQHMIAVRNAGTGIWQDIGPLDQVGSVSAIVTLPGGDLICAGRFTSIAGIPVSNIARWNPSSGVWSAMGSPGLATIGTLAIASNGEVIAGGGTSLGSPDNGIVRWNATTSVWAPIASGTHGGVVYSVAVLPNDDLVVSGNFNNAGGGFLGSVVRWEAASNTWRAISANPQLIASALVTLPNGDVVMSGGIPTPQSQIGCTFALWNPATGAFKSAHGGGLNARVRALAPLATGDVVAGGDFTVADGIPASRIARLNSNTNTWAPLGGGTNGSVFAIATLGGSQVIAGGSFTTAGSISAASIARWESSSATWSPLGAGVNASVLALAGIEGNDVIAAGTFTSAGGSPASRVARWNAGAGTWSALGTGLDGPVNAILVLPGGDIVAGGSFAASGTIPLNSVARWSSSAGIWTPMGGGLNGPVYALAALPGGDLVAGGQFTGMTGPAGLARWNATLGTWSGFGPGWSGGTIRSIVVLQDGDLVLGGAFPGPTPGIQYNAARWHAVSGTWSPLGKGLDGPVLAMLALPNGDVEFGGEFARAGAYSAPYFSRWTSDGPLWLESQTNAPITRTNVSVGIGVRVGSGYFDLSYRCFRNGVPVSDGPGGASPGGGTVMNSSGFIASTNLANSIGMNISYVQPSDAGAYHVEITSDCGSVVSIPATLTVLCPGDFNGDSTVNISDIFSFIGAWFSGDLHANYSRSGILNIQDIFDFLAAWFRHC